MDLLTPAQRAQIRSAIKDVTDTFMKTPILYERFNNRFDRFNEGNGERFTNIPMLGLLEYTYQDGDKIKRETGGAIEQAAVKISFNLEDMVEWGVVETTNWTHNLNMAEDFVTTQNERYKVVHIVYDGPLDQKNALIVVYADIEAHTK